MQWSGPKLGWHKEDVNPHLQKYTDLLLGGDGDGSDGGRIFVPLCGKSVDLVYLASHQKVSHVVGIDIVRNAAEDLAAEHPGLLVEEVQPSDECAAVSEGDAEQAVACVGGADDSSSDPSKPAVSLFRGEKFTFLVRDLFDLRDKQLLAMALARSEPSSEAEPSEHHFDSIYDRASMVAIHPSLRKDYVALMGELLRPGGAILLVSLDRRKCAHDEAKNDGPPFSIDEGEIRELYESQPWVESVTLLEEVNDLATDSDRERWEKKGVLELYEIVFLIKKK